MGIDRSRLRMIAMHVVPGMGVMVVRGFSGGRLHRVTGMRVRGRLWRHRVGRMIHRHGVACMHASLTGHAGRRLVACMRVGRRFDWLRRRHVRGMAGVRVAPRGCGGSR
ncbi:hypothetical protein [Stenotrophomonas acidaminiphila]|uniref:hypothetical protein n=1 Tax=Stenotrophomonas acidaminiphila TaxID=128780 RepID=UPI0028AECCB2|nr:hypothetical protein [Stenotrophomonas acidaminiphila]